MYFYGIQEIEKYNLDAIDVARISMRQNYFVRFLKFGLSIPTYILYGNNTHELSTYVHTSKSVTMSEFSFSTLTKLRVYGKLIDSIVLLPSTFSFCVSLCFRSMRQWFSKCLGSEFALVSKFKLFSVELVGLWLLNNICNAVKWQ